MREFLIRQRGDPGMSPEGGTDEAFEHAHQVGKTTLSSPGAQALQAQACVCPGTPPQDYVILPAGSLWKVCSCSTVCVRVRVTWWRTLRVVTGDDVSSPQRKCVGEKTNYHIAKFHAKFISKFLSPRPVSKFWRSIKWESQLLTLRFQVDFDNFHGRAICPARISQRRDSN